jgi:hypothetical protein
MHILIFISFLIQISNNPKVKERIENEKFKLLMHNNDSLYLSRTSGIIYRPFDGKFIRVDNSYDDKVHVRSLDFFHNDTLYRFGGYGYFNVNKNLIFFDKSTYQWDLVKYKGFNKIESFSNVGIHFFSDNQLNVIGYDSNENEFQNESNFKLRGFIFDFQTKSINKVFKIKEDFRFPTCYYQVNSDYVFLFYKGEREIKILKTSNYDLFTYKITQIESLIVNHKDEDFFLDDNQLKFKIENIDRNIVTHSIDINSVLDNMKFDDNLIQYRFNYFYLIICLVILAGVISYYFINKKNKFILTLNSLKYGRKSIDMDLKMHEVVKMLIGSSEVSNINLNQVFEVKDQNPLHINREKNNCLDRINKIFEMNFGESLIFSKKNENDRRMNLFYLNPKISIVIKT